jgi:hypothetical protein
MYVQSELLCTDYWVGDIYMGLIVHQQKYWPSDSNKPVDIWFSVYDAFLESSSSDTLKAKILESQII